VQRLGQVSGFDGRKEGSSEGGRVATAYGKVLLDDQPGVRKLSGCGERD